MAVKIGSLEIDLRANSAQFIQGMQRAQGAMSGFIGQFGKLQTLLIGGAGLAGFGAAIKGSIDFANNLGDLNTRLGFSTEFLSQMKFAAESSGVGFGTLTTSMQRFTRRLAEARQGSGVLVDALEQLGLDADELTSLGADEAFLRWADALAKVEDPGLRAALAMKGMDTEGVALIQVLAGGAEGMREMTEEADRLGLTVSGETAAAATEFNFALGKLTSSGKGFVNQITAQILPTLVKFVSGLTDTSKGMESARIAGAALDVMLKGLLATGQIVGAVFQNVGRGLGAVAASIVAVTEGEFSRALSILQDFQQEAATSVLDTAASIARITGLVEEQQNSFRNTSAAAAGSGTPGVAASTADPAAARDTELGQRRALADAQRVQNRLAAEGARIFAATRTPAEELAMVQERLNELLQLGAIDQETFNRAMLDSQDRFREATDAMKENQDAAVEFMNEHVALWEEQQAAIAQTQEDTQKALFGSLERGLQGLVQGTMTAREAFASMTANILSQLARIAAEETFQSIFSSSGGGTGGGGGNLFSRIFGRLLGAQNGASFAVGGAGGADSQVVAFRATPGEQVNVGGGAGGGSPIMVVQNMSFSGGPAERQTLDQVGFQAGEAIREAMARNG